MLQRRHSEIDNSVFGMNLVWAEPEFGRICLAGANRARKNILKLGFVVDELQQGFSVRPVLTDAEQIFGSGIQCRDQQVLIEKNDTGV